MIGLASLPDFFSAEVGTRGNYYEEKSDTGGRKLQSSDIAAMRSECEQYFPKPIEPFRTRQDLAFILQNEGMQKGAELGVANGVYSKEVLQRWTKSSEYHLVDLWGHQENYEDISNGADGVHEERYRTAMSNLSPWKNKITVCRNFTTKCAENYPDDYFDFVYVDARHDYKGVAVDLNAWWPKVRKGGIFAGHDYITQEEVGKSQDWTKNFDGTIDSTKTVVKGAVDAFSLRVNRQLTISYREKMKWVTWAMRK
jgi:hypothetical protein